MREIEPEAVRLEFEKVGDDGAELLVEETYPEGVDPEGAAAFYQQRLGITEAEVVEESGRPMLRASTEWMPRDDAYRIAGFIATGLIVKSVERAEGLDLADGLDGLDGGPE